MAASSSTRRVALVAAAAGLVGVVHSVPALMSVSPGRWGRSIAGRGDPQRVALTFDDGPNPVSTPRFLDALRHHKVHATFFLLGCMAARSPELCRAIAADGHEVAIHGWTHRSLLLRGPVATYTDLARTRDLLTRVTGRTPTHFRPPYGVFSTSALLAARSLGLRPVLWTCWGKDWTPSVTPQGVLDTLRPGLTGGATVLLHDSDDERTPDAWRSTLAALPRLLDECAQRGLRVGPLQEHFSPSVS